jgi:transcriptional regulator with XRE-family HTH domain
MRNTLPCEEDVATAWGLVLSDIRKEVGFSRSRLSALTGVGTDTIEKYEKHRIVESSIYKIEIMLLAMGYDLDALKIRD